MGYWYRRNYSCPCMLFVLGKELEVESYKELEVESYKELEVES